MPLRYRVSFCALAGLLIAGWVTAQPGQPGVRDRGGQPNRGGG
jgi:hypothetical protein